MNVIVVVVSHVELYPVVEQHSHQAANAIQAHRLHRAWCREHAAVTMRVCRMCNCVFVCVRVCRPHRLTMAQEAHAHGADYEARLRTKRVVRPLGREGRGGGGSKIAAVGRTRSSVRFFRDDLRLALALA